MSSVFLHCRAGFEKECAAEIQQRAGEAGVAGFCRALPHSGFVEYEAVDRDDAARRLVACLRFDTLVFARQWFVVLERNRALPADDRVTAMVDGLRELPEPAGDLFVEHPDTNEGKSLSRLCKALRGPLKGALNKAGLMATDTDTRIHVCLLAGTDACMGYAPVANSSPWPMGIVHLRLPRAAPSRATLKLDEALLQLLPARKRDRLVQPGMRAVDLGAAPGGWTWQLVRRHLRVIAVDNGAMAPALLESGLVDHRRADGFGFQPPSPVDWMVCDMVEQPMRIARLAARWIGQGWCRHTIFNLKLPMKQRYPEVRRCLDAIADELQSAGVRYRLACKQLYHDREEVTVYLGRTA